MSPAELDDGHRIACRLDELLEERGMTLTGVAETTGISKSTLSDFNQLADPSRLEEN